MLDKTSKILLLITSFINLYLLGLYRGFDFHFSKYGNNSFISGGEYFSIIFFLFIFLVSLFSNKTFFSPLICIFSLFFILYQYRSIYIYTRSLSDEGEPFVYLFNESIPLNYMSLVIVIILIFVQFITLYKQISNKK